MILAIAVLGGLGLFFGVGLAFAAKRFAVTADPKVEQIVEVLAGPLASTVTPVAHRIVQPSQKV